MRSIIVFLPLHKGADGWMNRKQFETFYWPSLKRVLNALVEEGLVPVLFAEGTYTSRLEMVNEFPKGAVGWWFDQTDMTRAKAILGDHCSIWGNVPSSLLVTGRPAEVKEYCRGLIETAGKGGGYVLTAGCFSDDGKLENLKAMVSAAREYGSYL
jgi:uroporphyrinogen-III decarboxylase